MARLDPRLAAGGGVLSVCLLLGGPGAAAIADPGDSRGGSDRGSSSDRGGENGRGESESDDNGRDTGPDGPTVGSQRGEGVAIRGSDDGPMVRVGSGRADTQQLAPSDSVTPSDRFTPSERSGSDHQGAPKANFERPRVTVGNGRSPGIQSNDPEPRWRAPAPQPEPAPPPLPPPPPPPAPSWVDLIYTPPPVPKQFVVAPAADLTDPLWGIAGLLLIPAAGAVLGYRQARAAHAAERLNRS